MTPPALSELSDDVLHCEVKRLAGRANTLLAELLAHLGEVEARGIHRERACSSLYAYCVYELRMSEDEAQRRCRAARLARQFPRLLAMLAEASLHLTGILLIGPHLTLENHQQLLGRVRFRTKREIERFVAELAPAPDAPARIEPLHDALPDSDPRVDAVAPARTRTTWAAYVRALAGPIRTMQAGTGAGQAPPAALPESGFDVSARSCGGGNIASCPAAPLAAQTPSANSGPRYRIQFTADQAFVDLLEEARELLQHAVSDRNFVEVQRRALQALVRKLRAKRCAASDRARASEPPSPAGPPSPAHTEQTLTRAAQQRAPSECTAPERRHIPAVVRRGVWQRDAARCSYTDARGQRCRERAGLELHHREPHARGGPASVDNLTLRCRAHNALAAEQDFGREWLLRKKSAHRAGAERLQL
jgi:5-methylcytosine-specific restriction endonuclease McrA